MAIIHGKTDRGEPYVWFTGEHYDGLGFERLFKAIKEEMALSQGLSSQGIGHNSDESPNENVLKHSNWIFR